LVNEALQPFEYELCRVGGDGLGLRVV
jgi:hypothetical protein